jgi:phenylacetate-CoA ligase
MTANGGTEFGLVAARCEAGRYHVHREHCLVEILDENGRPCAPGQTGHIIVTGLSNHAMPLIRYDTGDLAEAASGNCPCNRTLPSFGEIVGRYGRIAYLPPGTMGPVLALREAIETMPAELMRDFREFQIHQFADRRMELRMITRAPLADSFYERIRRAWAKAAEAGGPELAMVIVDQIPKSGGKAEVFTSDFMPARDGKPAVATASRTGERGGD